MAFISVDYHKRSENINQLNETKPVLWDNFTSCPEIINLILFSSDNSFVLCHGGKLIFIVTIFKTSVYSRGTRYPPHVSFVTTLQRAMFQELKTTWLHEESVTWKIMTSVKSKI